MEHLFIPLELAIIAKDKGFDEECLAGFTEVGAFVYGEEYYYRSIKTDAPLYQQITDWLRDKHNIFITILPNKDSNEQGGKVLYHTTIIDTNTDYSYSLIRRLARDQDDTLAKSFDYHQALNQAIKKALEMV